MCFGVTVPETLVKEADTLEVPLFAENVIYTLLDKVSMLPFRARYQSLRFSILVPTVSNSF